MAAAAAATSLGAADATVAWEGENNPAAGKCAADAGGGGRM